MPLIPDHVPTAMAEPDMIALRHAHATAARQIAKERGCDCDCEVVITEQGPAFYAQILHDNWCAVWNA